MQTALLKNISAPAAVTATTTGSGVDISAFTGNGYAVLNSTAMGGTATPTSNVKLQHSADNGVADAWADSGFAFDQVDAAASFQAKYISLDQFKKFVRVVNTVTGTTPTQTYSVEMVGTPA